MMFYLLTFHFIFALLSFANSQEQVNGSDQICLAKRKRLAYPFVRRANTAFIYQSLARHGNVTIEDPYNWQEESVESSSELQTFINQQVNLTNSFIKKCSNIDLIKQSIQSNFDYFIFDQLRDWGPVENPIYLYNVLGPNDQRQTWYLANQTEIDQSISKKFIQPIGKKFFNESLLSNEGNGAQHIQNIIINKEKTLIAYTISNGPEQTNLYFRNLSSPFIEFTPDQIPGGTGRWSEFLINSGTYSFIFSPDNQGLFYDQISYDQKNDHLNSRIRYHKFGTDQKQDLTIVNVDQKNPSNTWNIQLSQDEKWLIVTGFKGIDSLTRMYLASVDQPVSEKMKWISIAPGYNYSILYLTNIENDFYFLTTRGNTEDVRTTKLTIDPNSSKTVDELSQLTDEPKITEVIPVRKNASMTQMTMINKTLLISAYVEKAKSTIYMYDLITGQTVQQLLPELIGTVESLSSHISSPQGFLTVSTFTSGRQTYQITKTDSGAANVKLWIDSKPKSLTKTAFKTEQRFATSKDGTQISFYLLYRAEVPFDGTRPAWLYFYGAYGDTNLPKYDPYFLSWVNYFGGTLCIAQVRGGGEFSETWHQGGILAKKQNTFDDVIAVAEYLADNKIAKRGKIIGDGRSAGGLAAMVVGNQAPEGLFGAIIPEKGPYDMLRYTKFYGGDLQIPEWGDPDIPADFDYIFPYSPLQNVVGAKKYPMIILSVAAEDSRVPPLHSFKMISELQYRLPNNVMPLLMYYFQGSGHIIGESSKSTQIELAAVKQCLTAHCLRLQPIKLTERFKNDS